MSVFHQIYHHQHPFFKTDNNMKLLSLVSFIIVIAVTTFTATTISAQVANYNATEATRAWYFCKLNACDPLQIMNGFDCPVCKEIEKIYGEVLTNVNVFYHMKALAHGYTAYSPKRNQIIVGFRGTRSIQWFYDFDFAYTNLTGCTEKNCYVHKGFWEIYAILQPNITLHVQALRSKYPSATVSAVGHSLGAATAAICAYDLVQRLHAPVTHLIDFGCPRTFNFVASDFVGDLFRRAGVSYFRLVWANDPVPKLPALEMGYKHVGPSEIWYPKNSTASHVVCKDSNQMEDLSASCSFRSVPIQFGDASDHGWYMGIIHGCPNN